MSRPISPGRRAGRAEPDRRGEALIDRDPVVRDVRRQVEHVARRELPFALGAAALEQLERCALDEREIALAAHAPEPRAGDLQQEDIVAVEMRPDSAARRGVAHHDIVEPRVRDEVELGEQRLRARQHFVHALHEQRPSARGLTCERFARERTVLDVPAPAGARDEPRLHVGARCKLEERLARDEVFVRGKRAACKQPPLLPVTAQERPGVQPGEHRGLHGARII